MAKKFFDAVLIGVLLLVAPASTSSGVILLLEAQTADINTAQEGLQVAGGVIFLMAFGTLLFLLLVRRVIPFESQ